MRGLREPYIVIYFIYLFWHHNQLDLNISVEMHKYYIQGDRLQVFFWRISLSDFPVRCILFLLNLVG